MHAEKTSSVVFGLLVLALWSLIPPSPQARGESNRAPIEDEVISRLHSTNQLEIRAGNLAREKGTSEAIRRYGDCLVRDHRLADQEILALARHESIPVTKPVPKSAEDITALENIKALESATGRQFDLAFLSMMHFGHPAAIHMLTEAKSQLPTESELRGFIEKLIPILKQHDQLAINLEQKAG